MPGSAGELYIRIKKDTGATTQEFHFPIVSSIEDTFSASLTTLPTIVYGVENNFCMDLGVTRRFSIKVERVSPVDYYNNSSDSDRWSNGEFYTRLRDAFDFWQNFGYDAEGNPRSPFAIPGLERYWQTGTFATEALTQEALRALDKAKAYGQPFYLYMSHYAIHVPIDRDERYFAKYRAKGLSDKEAAYASLIEGMDKSLGDIMQWLEENGLTENTIILFMGDNGGYCTGSYWRDEPLYTQNYPLNCGKGSAYEGGIREPMIVCWPGVTRPGSRCDSYVMIEDYFPTILEMAGVRRYETRQTVDGVSFVPLLRGTGDPSRGRSLYWNFPNLWADSQGPGIAATATVRRDNWKLIYYYETGRRELFDIPNDISEKHDVAEEHPDVVERLSKELGRYLRKVGGMRPTFLETGRPCPWPDEL